MCLAITKREVTQQAKYTSAARSGLQKALAMDFTVTVAIDFTTLAVLKQIFLEQNPELLALLLLCSIHDILITSKQLSY